MRGLLASLTVLLAVAAGAQQKPAPPPAATISGVLTSADLGLPLRDSE
jgi:hypothetical protein